MYSFGVNTDYMEYKMNNKPNDLNKREWDIMVKYTKLFLLMFAVLVAISGILLILGSMAFIVVEVTNAY